MEITGPFYDLMDGADVKPVFTVTTNPEYSMEFLVTDGAERYVPFLMCDVYELIAALQKFAEENQSAVAECETQYGQYRVKNAAS